MRRAWAVIKWTPLVVATAFWIQSAATFPDWLASVAHDLSRNNGEWIVRVTLAVCGLIFALVALGPERVSRVKRAMSGSDAPPAEPHPIPSRRRPYLEPTEADLAPVREQMDRMQEDIGPMIERAQRDSEYRQRRESRLALATETEQLSAELIGLHERWAGPINAQHENAIGLMLEEYHAKYRVRSLALFNRLVQEGVMLHPDRNRPFFERPMHPGVVGGLPDLLDEAAARLRLSDQALAGWLGDQIAEFKSLAADLREQGERPVPVMQTLNVIHHGFSKLNGDVAERIRRDAKVWLDYWTENPPWFNSELTRITAEQLLEEVRFYEWAADRLAFLNGQVA